MRNTLTYLNSSEVNIFIPIAAFLSIIKVILLNVFTVPIFITKVLLFQAYVTMADVVYPD